MEETKEESTQPSLFKDKDEDSLFAKRQDSLDSLTPKIALAYSDFKFIEESEYYRTFEAVSKTGNEVHTIRVLNVDSSFYKADPNLASTLFVQELLRLCITAPQAALIETFEVNGNKISYAIQHCQTLQHLLDKTINPKDINIEYLLTDVLSDVSFLLSTLKLSNNINIELQNINYIWSTNSFILSDWGKNEIKKNHESTSEKPCSNGATEVYSLGMKILEFHGISKQELKELELLKNIHMYNGAVDAILTYLNLPAESRNKLKRTLIRDLNSRMKLGELVKDQASRKTEISSNYGSKINNLLANKPEFKLRLEEFIKEFESGNLSARTETNRQAPNNQQIGLLGILKPQEREQPAQGSLFGLGLFSKKPS